MSNTFFQGAKIILRGLLSPEPPSYGLFVTHVSDFALFSATNFRRTC